ncbi:hypothetical protein NF212_17940 [Parasalinivibrio latis]|uniref:hypothetical protein n=1 Tax=Parasalinivibrio latis TaxID=2952610 RepID=UPI0030E421DD
MSTRINGNSSPMMWQARQNEERMDQLRQRKEVERQNQASSAREEREKEQEHKRAEEAQQVSRDRGDYKNLIDRVADQEAKKAKLSAYTQQQQALLKQVEKAVKPQDEDSSYQFKV